MNKNEERYILSFVYPVSDWTITEHESPDFIFSRNGKAVLGCEVTELFYSEADARLQKIEGYAYELIFQRKYRHKDDITRLILGNAAVHSKEGKLLMEGPCVCHGIRCPESTIKKLQSRIEEKEDRIESYLRKVPVADLVINDASQVFKHENFKDLYFEFIEPSRNMMVGSRYREIFLVTTGRNNTHVWLPLKMLLFAEDIHLLRHMIEKCHPEMSIHSRQFHELASRALFELGYKHMEINYSDEKVGYISGAWEFRISKEGLDIFDYVTIPERLPHGKDACRFVGGPDDQLRDFVKQVLIKRAKYKCFWEFNFPPRIGAQ